MIHKVLILLVVVASYTYASKMCRDDDNCADLGDVFCMKSRCDWGLCGCPRGQAMRFLGSEKLFQCVPIRRVGESCSTDGDEGVCGAQNSECIDGKCICDHSDTAGTKRWSYWGGELCDRQLKSTSGETCSDSLGSCSPSSAPSTNCKKGDSWWGGIESPLDTLPNTCGCQDGYRVALDNDFDVHEFTGKTLPICVPIKHGELCLRDEDCRRTISGMECVGKQCVCIDSTHVPHFDGETCAAPISLGAVCSGAAVGHCDGTKGLVCGDVCDMERLKTGDPKKCVCDKSYINSSPCKKRDVGSSCKTDYECKSASRTGVCVDEVCKASAGMIMGNLFIILLAVMFTMQQK